MRLAFVLSLVGGVRPSDDCRIHFEPTGIPIRGRIISPASRTFVERSSSKSSEADGEAAFRAILLWMGEDPDWDELLEIPGRVAHAFQE